MDYSQEKLDNLHRVLVEILDYVVEICEKNGLTYFLVGGTALGAYRHKGFIPWDDDLDIAMPRQDYNNLIDILRSDNNKTYLLQDEFNEDNYFLPFIKIRKKNTLFLEAIAKGLYNNNGIYIDIFPIDYVDNYKSVGFKISLTMIRVIGYVLRFRTCQELYKEKESKPKFFLSKLLSLFFSRISNKRLLEIQRKKIYSFKGNSNRFFINFASVYSWKKEVFNYGDYLPVKEIMFEGKKYKCPSNIEKYLSQVYGNFMELPPEDKRHSHEPLKLVFDTTKEEERGE